MYQRKSKHYYKPSNEESPQKEKGKTSQSTTPVKCK